MRGGRRPGAGAPTGNTNALKTGRHSIRVKAVIDALLADPETREVLLRIGAKGRTRNVYARELAIAMTRLMHDQPIAEAKRALALKLADLTVARNAADQVNAEIATFEHQRGRDAFTDAPLTHRPRQAPTNWQSTRYVVSHFPSPSREPDNPPYTSAVDGRPYPLGPNGKIDDEEYDRLLTEWEQDRYGTREDEAATPH
jgi:hypothetical protein